MHMKAQAPVVIVLSILATIVIIPAAFAGTCVLSPEEQCLNTTTVITSTGLIEYGAGGTGYDGSQSMCEALGGAYDSSDSITSIAACTPGVCCDSGQDFIGSNNCNPGEYRQLDFYDPDSDEMAEVCSQPPPTQLCNGVPYDTTTQECCWDNSIANRGSCPALPNPCTENANVPAGSWCFCGAVNISTGACCTGGRTAPDAAACTSLPPATLNCGNNVLDAGEACDATYLANGAVQGVDCSAGNTCTSACQCVTTGSTIGCRNGICDSQDYTCSAADYEYDCPSPPACNDPNAIPGSFNPVYDTKLQQTNISWLHPLTCAAERQAYYIQRAKNPQASLFNPDLRVQLSKDTITYTDVLSPQDIAGTTNLYYSIIIEYIDGTRRNVTRQVNLPSSDCPVSDISYCGLAANGKQKAITCINYQTTAETRECLASEACLMVNNGRGTIKAACIAQATCSECNGIFGTFPEDTYKIWENNYAGGLVKKQCQDALTCYKDIGNTSVPLYKECGDINSCLGYKSKDACEINKCNKPGNCSWTQLGVGSGICAPQLPEFVVCSACNSLSSCTKSVCENLDPQCFYHLEFPNQQFKFSTSNEDGCYNKQDVPCEWLETQAACEGGTQFSLDATNYTEYSRSNDILSHGKCTWINGACWKDSNDNNNPDVLTEFTGNANRLILDFSSPETGINISAYQTYGVKFNASFAASSTDTLRICLEQKQGWSYPWCTPSTSGLLGNVLAKTFLSSESGDWVLRYYGEDPARNIEAIKEFYFSIDAVPPQVQSITEDKVILRTGYTTGTNPEPIYGLKYTVFFNTTELARCSTNLKKLSAGTLVATNRNDVGAPPGAAYELSNVYGQNFSVQYPALVSNTYRLFIMCTDAVGNTKDPNLPYPVWLTVDNDYRITNPRPRAPSSANNITSVRISIDTAQDTVCRYGARGASFNTMTAYTVTGGKNHSKILSGLVSGNYSFQNACNASGTIVYGDPTDDIIFAIDISPPVTDICAVNGTRLNCAPDLSIPGESYRISFNCTDYPRATPRFNCNAAAFAFCVQNASEPGLCTPSTSSSYPFDVTGTEDVRIRYYSTDSGGNVESIKEMVVRVRDLTPPGAPQWSIIP